MYKFSVDLDNMARSLSQKTFKLSEIKDKIEKIAWDVVRFKDGNPEELWRIQDADDGQQYIVALYNEEEKVATASVSSKWSILVKNADLHVFYNKDYVCKVSANQLGFQNSDLALAKQYLPNKLSSNKKLANSLLEMLEPETLKTLLSKYPELV